MVLPNPLGGVLDRNWPDGLSDTLAAQVDDAAGLQFSGQRYYDPFVGSYIQPNPFGGGPGGPQSLNRFSAAAGALPAQPGNGRIPPLLVDIGKSTVSNSIGAGLGNRLETIPGRLVGAASQWRMLQIQILPWARGRYYAWTMAEFIRHRVQVGPFFYHPVSSDKRFHKLLVSRLPDNPVSLARSLDRNGVTINWRPAFRPLPSQVWEFNFLLNKVSPELAEHFTLGSFASGGLADALIGGFLQGFGDHNRHNLWAQDPWLATRRVGAAAGANATVGLIGGGATAIGFSALIWAGVLSTPPGWAIAGTTIGVTVFTDILIGDSVKKKWFHAFDADRPYLEN